MLKRFFSNTIFMFLTPLALLSVSAAEGTPFADLPAYAAGCHCPCVGPEGPIGPQGPRGFPGITGPQGPLGAEGDVGPVGLQGPQGPQGPTGAQGNPGINGAAGLPGLPGVAGPQGPTGVTGAQGLQGLVGAQGAQGATGIQGVTGPQGLTGGPLAYGYFYTLNTQSVPPGGVVNLVSNDPAGVGFIQVGGGVQVPLNGIYLIYFQCAPGNTGTANSIALRGDATNGAFDATAFANVADSDVIAGSVIVPMRAGEIVFIINNNIVTTFNTTVTGITPTAGRSPNHVDLTIMLLLVTP